MSYMKQVANMLGVELGEEFRIKSRLAPSTNSAYKFTEAGLYVLLEGVACDASDWLFMLLRQDADVVKMPFVPNEHETYFFVETSGDVECTMFESDCAFDTTNRRIGNCYRTKVEAEANREKWVQWFAGTRIVDVFREV